jgi:hypothetical protein
MELDRESLKEETAVTPVCIWEDITKMGIKDLVCEGVD